MEGFKDYLVRLLNDRLAALDKEREDVLVWRDTVIGNGAEIVGQSAPKPTPKAKLPRENSILARVFAEISPIKCADAAQISDRCRLDKKQVWPALLRLVRQKLVLREEQGGTWAYKRRG